MSFSKNIFSNKRGNLGAIMGVLIGSTALMALIAQFMHIKSQSVTRRLKDTRYTISVASGVESMLTAYRLAELTYLQDVSACTTANPFLVALKEGSACVGAPHPALFQFKESRCGGGGSTPPLCSGRKDGAQTLWTYGTTGCKILTNSSDCSGSAVEIMSIGAPGDEAQKLSADSESFKFTLTNIDLSKGIAEMIETTIDSAGKPSKHAFAIRSTLDNAAHVEADGRTTQESPNPLSYCQGAVWGTYFLLSNKKCTPFVELGSGTGLAFYEGRYFGFRPFDGQVIDMLAASETPPGSYLVPEKGVLPPIKRPDCIESAASHCEEIFPPYNKNLLVNVDDITLVGNQIYYVAHSGDSAHIGYLRHTVSSIDAHAESDFERIKVCDLGGMGWAQAYAGIAAMSWSDPLEGSGSPTSPALARFFLKTDSGDLLTVLIENKASSVVDITLPGTLLTCFVSKDSNIQQIEYKRTYGFDRTANTKPYYIY